MSEIINGDVPPQIQVSEIIANVTVDEIVAAVTAKMQAYDAGNLQWTNLRLDPSTSSLQTITYPHHEIHGGSAFFALYSVADIGAMTTPNDTISLTFTTPNTTKWPHMIFEFQGGGGALCTVREAGTGGASPTGAISCINRNRNSETASTILSIAGTPVAGQISYDATLDTGGTAFQIYLPGTAGNPAASKVGALQTSRGELVLKQNTRYQVSMVDTENVPATIILDWYEHTDHV